MKASKFIIACVIAATGCLSASAQTTAETAGSATAATQENMYTNQDFDGLIFQVPAGMRIDRGSAYVAKYPDGTFGISMEKINHPANKKISFELCKRLADSMHLPRNLVRKANFGKAKGAMAQGKIEGMIVTCIVLPLDDHQVQIVALCDPSREDWMRQFLSTLRK